MWRKLLLSGETSLWRLNKNSYWRTLTYQQEQRANLTCKNLVDKAHPKLFEKSPKYLVLSCRSWPLKSKMYSAVSTHESPYLIAQLISRPNLSQTSISISKETLHLRSNWYTKIPKSGKAASLPQHPCQQCASQSRTNSATLPIKRSRNLSLLRGGQASILILNNSSRSSPSSPNKMANSSRRYAKVRKIRKLETKRRSRTNLMWASRNSTTSSLSALGAPPWQHETQLNLSRTLPKSKGSPEWARKVPRTALEKVDQGTSLRASWWRAQHLLCHPKRNFRKHCLRENSNRCRWRGRLQDRLRVWPTSLKRSLTVKDSKGKRGTTRLNGRKNSSSSPRRVACSRRADRPSLRSSRQWSCLR